ncbi:MAG: HAD family hydrolase [Acidobacteriota bacterium]
MTSDTPKAIVFDLYGTLVELTDRSTYRGIPDLLGVDRRAWMKLIREVLLVRDFEDEALARFIVETLTGEPDAELERQSTEVLQREVDGVVPLQGMESLMHFLKHRGFKLGLVSNLSSPHIRPFEEQPFAELFDAIYYSCREGRAKPDSETYAEICRRLEVEAGDVLFVGDSLRNDVTEPKRFGMRSVRVGSDRPEALRLTSDLGWLRLSGAERFFEPLIELGKGLPTREIHGQVTSLEPVPDKLRGRYNLVSRAVIEQGSLRRTFYCKRFMLEESAYLEELAYRVHKVVGLSSCRACVAKTGDEPFLVVSEAPGARYEGKLRPEVAYELGQHHVFAYVFANADMRPRNAFLATGERPGVTMIDLEHCFFSRALNVEGIDDPFDPAAIDALSTEEIEKRTRRMVLTPRTMTRSRRSYFRVHETPKEMVRTFRQGFLEFYESLKADRQLALGFLSSRLARRPHLAIGTRAYRRAMARIDIEDIGRRIDQDPLEVLDSFCALDD